jgi:hypothetical protein
MALLPIAGGMLAGPGTGAWGMAAAPLAEVVLPQQCGSWRIMIITFHGPWAPPLFPNAFLSSNLRLAAPPVSPSHGGRPSREPRAIACPAAQARGDERYCFHGKGPPDID